MGGRMKIKEITYPTALNKIPNVLDDNIDVFVETEEGLHFTMTVCTPAFYMSWMEKEKLEFVPAAPPDVIVKELNHENIKNALETYCEDHGYWMKLYFLAGQRDGIFAEEKLDEMMRESDPEESDITPH